MYRSIEINIMNIFKELPAFGGKYVVVSERRFSEEEINIVNQATTVASEFGISVCFFMKTGVQKYIPLSTESSAGVGETLDLTKASIVVLRKVGATDIMRIMY